MPIRWPWREKGRQNGCDSSKLSTHFGRGFDSRHLHQFVFEKLSPIKDCPIERSFFR